MEPVTCPAAPQNVSRIVTGASLDRARAEETISRVAETREDVTVVVELAVERCGVDGDVGMRLQHAADALGGCDEAEEADTTGAGPTERARRGDGGAAGREHRVEDEEV